MEEEKTNKRLATYSLWHRTESIVRYVPNHNIDIARSLGMIDIDNVIWVEFHRGDQIPLALIETALDGPDEKNATVLRNLARMADLPAYVIRYGVGGVRNPAYPQVEDILSFRSRRLHPDPERAYRSLTCEDYVVWLAQLREQRGRLVLRNEGLL